MTDQFLFFCTNIGNEKFLKEEIRIFYPDFSLSYSRKGFITYKNKGIKYDLNTIFQLELTFATRAGICLGKCKPESLFEDVSRHCDELKIDLSKCIIHNFSVNTDFELEAQDIFKKEINEYSPINKTIINLIALGENEIWYGVHKTGKLTTNFPNANPDIIMPIESPSRSYLKIAEAIKLFNISVSRTDNWLDFGSAPGGASYYLLSLGCKVWGIDPAKMAKMIMDNTSYVHIEKPVQDLSQEELPFRDIHWVHADLNLNPNQSIKEVLRLCKKYSARLKGIIFTIPMIKMDYIEDIEELEDRFLDWGFTNVTSRQIPSHKNEYVIIAKR